MVKGVFYCMLVVCVSFVISCDGGSDLNVCEYDCWWW